MRDSIGFVFCRHYTKAAESRFHIFTLTLSPRFMYQYCFSSAGRGNGRGAMSFLMSFALEPEIVTLAWIDNASVQFPLNIYATKGFTLTRALSHRMGEGESSSVGRRVQMLSNLERRLWLFPLPSDGRGSGGG